MCQPLDGSHSIMTGDNRAHRISVILRKITAIHPVGDHYFPLNCFVSGQTTGIGDRTGRYRLYVGRSLISSFEHDLTSIFFHASALQKAPRGTPVHAALPTAPSSHCAPSTWGIRKTRPLPAHSKVATRVSEGISRNSL